MKYDNDGPKSLIAQIKYAVIRYNKQRGNKGAMRRMHKC